MTTTEEVFVSRRFPKLAVRETSVDMLWIGGTFIIAFGIVGIWLGALIGVGILVLIPVRRYYPAIRKNANKIRIIWSRNR